MPDITLAGWYGDHKPGETLDVDAATVKALRRDGLLAEPAEETPQEEQAPAKTVEEPAQPEPETGRKKR